MDFAVPELKSENQNREKFLDLEKELIKLVNNHMVSIFFACFKVKKNFTDFICLAIIYKKLTLKRMLFNSFSEVNCLNIHNS